jgi:hypothetical protein
MTTGRALDSDFASLMQGVHVESFILVEMGFDSGTLYLVGLAFPVTWNGNLYAPVMGLGAVQSILETDSEVQGLTFSLSAVPESAIATVLEEPIQGRPVIVRQVALKPDGSITIDQNVWQGLLDTMTIDDQGPTSTITVTAEHKLAAWSDANLSRFSDEDQQAKHPGDLFFQYAAQMAEATIVWPNKTFFRQ